jgi:hypothetical protein
MSEAHTVAVIGGDIRNKPVLGSVRGHCAINVRHRVWLSPASQTLVEAGATIFCWDCYRALPDAEKVLQGESPEGVRRLYAGELPLDPR